MVKPVITGCPGATSPIFNTDQNKPCLIRPLRALSRPSGTTSTSCGGSHDEFPDPSRRGVDAQSVVDLAQPWLGEGCLADMESAAVALTERRRQPLLHRQDLAQTGP